MGCDIAIARAGLGSVLVSCGICLPVDNVAPVYLLAAHLARFAMQLGKGVIMGELAIQEIRVLFDANGDDRFGVQLTDIEGQSLGVPCNAER